MSIEFRCSSCQKLLRVPEGTAGRQTRCPSCEIVLTIPAASSEGSASSPQDAPESPSPFQSPGAEQQGAGMPPGGPAAPPAFDSDDPYQAPADYDIGTPTTPAGRRPLQARDVSAGDVIGRSWSTAFSRFGSVWGVIMLTWLVLMAVFFVASIPMGILIAANPGNEPAIVIGQLILQLITSLVQLWIGAGVTMCMLQIGRGAPLEIGTIFQGGPYFLRLLGMVILTMLLLMGIYIAVAIPVGLLAGIAMALANEVAAIGVAVLGVIGFFAIYIYVLLGLTQAWFLIVDREMGVIDSLKTSWQLMKGNRLAYIGVQFVVIIAVGAVVLLVAAIGAGSLNFGEPAAIILGFTVAGVVGLIAMIVFVPFLAIVNTIFHLELVEGPPASVEETFESSPAENPFA